MIEGKHSQASIALHQANSHFCFQLHVRDLSVELYEHANFQGISAKVGVGQYNYHRLDKTYRPHDRITSLKVPEGLQITLFENADFVGESRILRGGEHQLSGMNDEASSFKVTYDVTKDSRYELVSDCGYQLIEVDGQPKLVPAGANQAAANRWQFTKAGQGYFHVKSANSRLVLTAAEDNAPIKLVAQSAASQQLWYIAEDPQRPYCYLPVNKASGQPMLIGQFASHEATKQTQVYFCFSDRDYPLPPIVYHPPISKCHVKIE
jgi:hypothetical protein